jgi:hypothetical protein
MATSRKLSDNDVKTVYECVYNNRRPPPQLSFKIVVVGPEGQRLSPPAIEFEGTLDTFALCVQFAGSRKLPHFSAHILCPD